jgi:hypothetical protein
MQGRISSQAADEKLIREIDGDLHRAINHGDKNAVEQCLNAKANPNVKLVMTPLHAAASDVSFDIMKLLLDAGAKLNHDELDSLMYNYKYQSKEKLEKMLDVVTLLINKKSNIVYNRGLLWDFLRRCDQRKVCNTLLQLCENVISHHLEYQRQSESEGHRHNVDLDIFFGREGMSAYLEKLKTVMQYSVEPPDDIMKERDECQLLTPQDVEKLSHCIYRKESTLSGCIRKSLTFFKNNVNLVTVKKFSIGFALGCFSTSAYGLPVIIGGFHAFRELIKEEGKSFTFGFILGNALCVYRELNNSNSDQVEELLQSNSQRRTLG